MTSGSLSIFAARLRAHAEAQCHRRLVILTGTQAQAAARAAQFVADAGYTNVLWIGAHAPPGAAHMKAARVHAVLGSEIDALVFDVYDGFDVEALAAAAGAIRGGGLLLLLAPPPTNWETFADPERARITVHPYLPDQVTGRFLARLARVFGADHEVILLSDDHATPPLPPASTAVLRTQSRDAECRTADQALAVAAVMHAATARHARPLVLIADRGRGKSTALAIAAARLVHEGTRTVLVTAPRFDSARRLMTEAERRLPASLRVRLRFSAPDALAHTPEESDLLLVDEAAALPAALLARLLRHYPRVVFATTVHGYEGTGRGFELRFRHELDAQTPGWRTVRLNEPVRWADGDPLERVLHRALLLSADPAAIAVPHEFDAGAIQIARVDRNALALDDDALAQCFGLLVLAHYRTSPLDLRHLLDGPNLSVYLARLGGQVIATALVAREGGIESSLLDAIWLGTRRPRGHLLPQSLSAHAGFREAPMLCGDRVVRIAVHPQLQGRGIGRRLLTHLTADAVAAGRDFIGSAFGATPRLLHFWENTGFSPVRLGISREASSGEHAVMVLRPLSGAGDALFRAARARLLANLPHELADPFRDVDPELVGTLVQHAPAAILDSHDWSDLVAFAAGHRDFATVLGPLHRVAPMALCATSPLDPTARQAFTSRVLQSRSWAATAHALGLTGQRQVTTLLRAGIRKVIDASAPDDIRALLSNSRA